MSSYACRSAGSPSAGSSVGSGADVLVECARAWLTVPEAYRESGYLTENIDQPHVQLRDIAEALAAPRFASPQHARDIARALLRADPSLQAQLNEMGVTIWDVLAEPAV